MKTVDFILEHLACHVSAKWALSVSKDMADVWDEMIKQNKHDWLLWAAIRPGVFPAPTLRRLACRFVRETPLSDGRKVWDLLTDERSRMAVEVAEAYAEGKATADELSAAYDSARDASVDSYDSAYAAAWATRAAFAAARAARSAARAAYAAWSAARAAEASAASDACAAAYAACAAGDAAAYYAVDADAYAFARAAAESSQVKMVAELGNPFKKES